MSLQALFTGILAVDVTVFVTKWQYTVSHVMKMNNPAFHLLPIASKV